MNKTDLVKKVSNETGIHEKDVALVVSVLINEILNGILEEDKVVLRGLGTFEQKEMKARRYSHPQTGEIIDVPNRKNIRFKPSSVLKKMLEKKS